jgi:hypothetical protein
MSEIIQQADGIEAGPFENDSHFVIVSVRIFAFPLVTAQGMARGKSFVNADLKHHLPLEISSKMSETVRPSEWRMLQLAGVKSCKP